MSNTVIICGVDEHDEPVSIQILFRDDLSAELYVDTLKDGKAEQCLARVYLDAPAAEKLRSL